MPAQSTSDDPSTDATTNFIDPADKVTERSTSTTILKLPPEILLTVFALVAVEDIGWGEDFEEISAPAYNARRLVPLMLTCRSWHALILDTPALWSTFTDNTAYRNVPLYKEYHARSGSAPIFLTVNRTLSDTSRALFLGDDPAFRHRLRSLAYVCSLKYHSMCYMFLSSSFPILEECVVLFPWGSRARAMTPPFNFLPDSKRLRVLSLVSLSGGLPTTAFPELRELRIQASDSTSLASMYASLLAFLSTSPRLRKLELSGLVDPSPTDYPRLAGRVRLPHLTELTLHHTPESWPRGREMLARVCEFTQHLLGSLDIPPSCALSFAPLDLGHWRALAGSLSCVSPADALTLAVPVERMERLTMDLSLCDGDVHRLAFKLSMPMPATSASDAHTEARQTLHAAFHDLAIFSSVHRLRVVAYATITLPPPSSALAALPHLHTLLIEDADFVADFGCRTGALLDALQPAQDGLPAGASSAACPRLRTLVVRCAGDDADAAPLRQGIVQVLRARAAAGVPIERPLLGYCKSSGGTETGEGDACTHTEEGAASMACLEVYDATGRLVRIIRDETETQRVVEDEWRRVPEVQPER